MDKEKVENIESNWFSLFVVMGGVFLSTMDSGMVNIALPTLMRHFDISILSAEKVITVYLLTITISLVFWGRIADRFGLERIYLLGVLIFSLGSFSGGCGPEYHFLLLARAVQGVGAAMMMSSGPAIIKRSFPEGLLGRNLGLVGVATACGLLSGPFVSGQILAYYSWNSIFTLTAVFSAIVMGIGIVIFAPKLLRPETGRHYCFDWTGALCWAGLVLLTINILHNLQLDSFKVTGLKALLLTILLTVFFKVERSAVHPILPMKSFVKRYYWIGVVTTALSFASLFSVLVLIPFYLEYQQAMSSQQIGIMMMAVPATLILLSPTAGYLYDRIGARFLTSFGLLVSCVGLLGISTLTPASHNWLMGLLLAAVGAGQSIFLSPNSASVLSRVPQHRLGTTAGILATARNFGMVSGATLATLLFAYFSSKGALSSMPVDVQLLTEEQFLYAFSMTFKCIAALSCSAALVSTLRK